MIFTMSRSDISQPNEHELTTPQVLRSKTTPPALTERTVSRQRLLGSLTASAAAPLSVIVAPAGFGKTTLALQYLAQLDGPGGWVSLEPADNDPVQFWTYFNVASGLLDEGVVEQILKDGPDGIDEALVVLRLAIEASRHPVVVVLDDYHLIVNEAIHEQLGNLLRHPPRPLRVVIMSRTDVPLPIGRLRVEGRLNEVGTDELAFALDETELLLVETLQLDIGDPSLVQTIADRTEGWAAGVHLAGLSLRSNPDDTTLSEFRGEHRHLSEYLASEVLATQPPEIRRFLLETSPLTHLHPDLCDAATGRTNSLAVLRELVAGNVFTSILDRSENTYRYHPLLREHLQAKLITEQPKRHSEIHHAAAQWHLQRRHDDHAIMHAIAAGDLDWARRLILDSFIAQSNNGRWITVQNWVGTYGYANARTHPDLCLMMAWSHLTLGSFDEVEPWLEAAQEAARLVDNP
ncbi:MAG: hypothetical protein ACC652_02850, partial [Acidimicrobiales bacterium]